ncbi:hypothetical protein GCM10011362_06530 [Marinobacter halophilus]|nr:hypothetical protein GCM10011362_06530 [Marinobacter halophilus]
MFGPQVDKGNQIYPGDFLNIAFVALGNGMGQYLGAHPEQSECQENPEEAVSAAGGGAPAPTVIKQR